jgi:hypothetical protein
MQAPAWAGPEERSSTVLLSVAAPAGETEAIEAVARELLARLDVPIEVRRVPRIDLAELRRALEPGERYFARVWITLSPAGHARLYLEHGASDRLLVREVAGDASNPELAREELGHILQTAVDGLKAGQEVGAPRSDALKDVPEADAAKAATEPAAPEPPSEAVRKQPAPSQPLRFGLRYELAWLGDGAHFEDGPGAVFALTLPVGFELCAFYRRPLKVEGTPVGVRLETLSLRALVTLQAWRGEQSGIRLGAGAGADFVSVSPLGEPEDAELAEETWLSLAVARLQIGYAWRAVSFLDVELTAGVDLDVNDTSYVFQQGSGELSVLDPWPVRPFVSLGAALP